MIVAEFLPKAEIERLRESGIVIPPITDEDLAVGLALHEVKLLPANNTNQLQTCERDSQPSFSASCGSSR
jgi:hypothetical protein